MSVMAATYTREKIRSLERSMFMTQVVESFWFKHYNTKIILREQLSTRDNVSNG
jgi:hypothetical protein